MSRKVRVQVLAPFKQYVDNAKQIDSEGDTLGEVLAILSMSYPKLREQLFGSSDSLRDFINVFVNGEDVRNVAGLDTRLKENDTILIMPAIAGGSSWERQFSL